MIRGGIVSTNNQVELNISMKGGGSYKKVYNDVVSVAINKFVVISETLNKIFITKTNDRDVKFFTNQVKRLLQGAHVEFIQGDMPFQIKYNMWLLDGYVRMLLENTDMKLIAQLLSLDSIIYSVEHESRSQGIHSTIDFSIPSGLKVKTIYDIDSKAKLSIPLTDELNDYLQSLNTNLILLSKLIVENRDALMTIYNKIVKTASNKLN